MLEVGANLAAPSACCRYAGATELLFTLLPAAGPRVEFVQVYARRTAWRPFWLFLTSAAEAVEFIWQVI